MRTFRLAVLFLRKECQGSEAEAPGWVRAAANLQGFRTFSLPLSRQQHQLTLYPSQLLEKMKKKKP